MAKTTMMAIPTIIPTIWVPGATDTQINEAPVAAQLDAHPDAQPGVPMTLAATRSPTARVANKQRLLPGQRDRLIDWSGLNDPFLEFRRQAVAFARPIRSCERPPAKRARTDVSIAASRMAASGRRGLGRRGLRARALSAKVSTRHSEKLTTCSGLQCWGDCEFTLPSVTHRALQRVADTGRKFVRGARGGSVGNVNASVAVFSPRTAKTEHDSKTQTRRRWFHFGRHPKQK